MHILLVLGISLFVAGSTAVPGQRGPRQGTKACHNNGVLSILNQLGASSFCSSYNHVSTKTVITTKTETYTLPTTIALTLVTSTSTATAALTTYTATTTSTAWTAIRTGALGVITDNPVKKRSEAPTASFDITKRTQTGLPEPLRKFRPAVISTACSCFVTTPTITATQFPFSYVYSTYTDTATAVVTATTTISTTTTTTISIVATTTAIYKYRGQLEHFCYPLGSENNLQGTEQDGLIAQNYTQAFDHCARVCYDDPACHQFSTHTGYTSIPFTYDCFFGSGVPYQQGWDSRLGWLSPDDPRESQLNVTCQLFDTPPNRPDPYQRYMLSYDKVV